MPAMTDTALPSPSLLRHLAALVYDTLLVIALLFAGVALGTGVQYKLTGQETLAPVYVWLIIALSFVGFYSLFWLTGGQTLGMQAWRMKLVCTGGGELTAGRVLLRCAAAVLSLACLGLGFLWKLVDPDRRYWHDRLSGTHLVLLPKKARKSGGDEDSASAP